MLTYQLHTRILVVPSGKELSFPNRCMLNLKLAPATAFGTENDYGRTLVKAHAASVLMNANNGKWQAKSNPGLEPLDVIFERGDSKFVLKGDKLTYEFSCESLSHLDGTLTLFKFIYPTLLNLEFSDPPIVLHIGGNVGGIEFRWEHMPQEWRIRMRTVEQEILERHIVNSLDYFPLFHGANNRRLAAAISYFHIACRLNVCGDSPWEFMAETILNYCKAVEILFVSSENSKDDIRKGLTILGYTDDEIEGDFIPLLILRSYVDVAHPKVAIYKHKDLRVLYSYLSQAEDVIRELLSRVIKNVNADTYSIRVEDDINLDSKDRKGMDRLVEKMESRLRVPLD
ncbi:MAG: hypothetical protein AB1810_14175 [Pseudomonadota bacterium]